MPIPLRTGFDAAALRQEAKRSKDAAQARRLPALAAVCEGASRTEAAGIGGVRLRIARDRVLRFKAHGPTGLIDRKPPGQPSRLDEMRRAALRAVIESGPIPALHGVRPKGGRTDVVRWRLLDLCQRLRDEFQVSIAKPTLSREVRALGRRKLSARPRHHAQAAGAIDLLKTASLPRWTKSRVRRASIQVAPASGATGPT